MIPSPTSVTWMTRWALATCVVVVFSCIVSTPAYAAFTLSACAAPGGFPPEAISGPIVYCVKSTIMSVVTTILATISTYMQGTVAAGAILAVTVHGAQIMSGERDFAAKSISFIFRVALVVIFSFNLGGLTSNVFAVMDQVLGWAVGGFSPWKMIDDLLGTLFGFAPGVAMFQGLIWLGAGLLSGTSSFAMSSGLIVTFIELILFVIEVIYTYLASVLVVAFVIIISPILVPTALFQYSERFFSKWLNMLLGSMLIPVFLFGFLSMSISVFSGLLCNVFVAILPNYSCTVPTDPSNPPDFHQFWKTNQPAFSWVMPTDPNFINDIKKTMATDPTREKLVPPVQIVINPFDRGGFNANAFNTPGINFGLNNGQVNQRLLFSLISLWLYAAVMKKMVEKMPEVAQEIAGAISGVRFNNPIGGGIKALQNKVNSALSDAKQGALTVGGAALSGGITGAATKNGVATEAATITGGIIGNVLSRKI